MVVGRSGQRAPHHSDRCCRIVGPGGGLEMRLQAPRRPPAIDTAAPRRDWPIAAVASSRNPGGCDRGRRPEVEMQVVRPHGAAMRTLCAAAAPLLRQEVRGGGASGVAPACRREVPAHTPRPSESRQAAATAPRASRSKEPAATAGSWRSRSEGDASPRQLRPGCGTRWWSAAGGSADGGNRWTSACWIRWRGASRIEA